MTHADPASNVMTQTINVIVSFQHQGPNQFSSAPQAYIVRLILFSATAALDYVAVWDPFAVWTSWPALALKHLKTRAMSIPATAALNCMAVWNSCPCLSYLHASDIQTS
jgi:hypothetical protein